MDPRQPGATWESYRDAAAMFLRGATLATATRIAVVVGTWLSLVNHNPSATSWSSAAPSFIAPRSSAWARGALPACSWSSRSFLSWQGPFSRAGQLLSEGGRDPLFVTSGCPASVADEKAIDLGGHQRVDQVGCVAFSQSGPECMGACK